MAILQDVQRVDLRQSTWDEATSDPSAGQYNWTKKVLINYLTPDRPPYFFKWCRWDPRNNYLDLRMWRAKWGYVPVQGPTKKGQLPGIDFDPYFPEGADINAEGHYIFGDVIWVRCPLLTEVNRILENEKVSTRGGSDRLRAFNTEMMQSGANIPMDILKQISDVF